MSEDRRSGNFSDDSGRRARRKCYDAGCRGCTSPSKISRTLPPPLDAAITGTAEKDLSLREDPINTRSAHDIRFTRHGRSPTYTLQTYLGHVLHPSHRSRPGVPVPRGNRDGKEHPQREVLPDNVVPLHYELALVPNAEALTFTGEVAITVKVTAATHAITLNAVGLTFDHAAIDGVSDSAISFDKKLGRATLSFAQPVAPGRHVLAIEYHGAIGRATLGFFAMDYAGPGGPRRILASNFEPADARDLLPCWDEPARKATFTVTIDAPKEQMAISNMPIAQVTSLSPTTQRVTFEQTPKMSTYLLFISVGDYERIQKRVDGVDVGVVVKRGDTGKAAYALDQAGTLLQYYNEYFGIRYPLPKLDLIAAPEESWAVPWRTGVLSSTRRTICFSNLEAPLSRIVSTCSWPSRTRWRTNGLAIWSRCPGGMTCG